MHGLLKDVKRICETPTQFLMNLDHAILLADQARNLYSELKLKRAWQLHSYIDDLVTISCMLQDSYVCDHQDNPKMSVEALGSEIHLDAPENQHTFEARRKAVLEAEGYGRLAMRSPSFLIEVLESTLMGLAECRHEFSNYPQWWLLSDAFDELSEACLSLSGSEKVGSPTLRIILSGNTANN